MCMYSWQLKGVDTLSRLSHLKREVVNFVHHVLKTKQIVLLIVAFTVILCMMFLH
jgi:hypothetical protein